MFRNISRGIAQHQSRVILALGVLVLTLSSPGRGATPSPQPSASEDSPVAAHPAGPPKLDFERDIAPIFQASCVICHGEQPQAQLRLNSLAEVLKGSVSGKVVIPGNSKSSALVRRLADVSAISLRNCSRDVAAGFRSPRTGP